MPSDSDVILTGEDITLSATNTTATGKLTINGELEAQNGITVENGGLTVENGRLTVENGGLTVKNGGLNVEIGGLTVDNGGLTVIGELKAQNGITVEDGGLTVNGPLEAKNALTADEGVTVNGMLNAQGGLTANALINAKMAIQCEKLFGIGGNIEFQSSGFSDKSSWLILGRKKLGNRSAAFVAEDVHLLNPNYGLDPSKSPHRAITHGQNDTLIINPNRDYKGGVAIEGKLNFKDIPLSYGTFRTPNFGTGNAQGLSILCPSLQGPSSQLIFTNTGKILLQVIPRGPSFGIKTIDLLETINNLQSQIDELKKKPVK